MTGLVVGVLGRNDVRWKVRMNRHWWVKPALVLLVFLVAFLPRAIYPVSRPSQWYIRSVMFVDRVAHGEWGETVYSEHPGVTTMWLSGLALRLAGVTPEQRPDGPYVDPGSLTARESAIGVLPLALAIATLITLSYLLLERLFDRAAAFGAAMLVALDPFFISNSKLLHVDGLLSAMMYTSALALLVFVRERRWRWIILSSALAGLALLTKSPALFLLPYTALCLGIGLVADRWLSWKAGRLGTARPSVTARATWLRTIRAGLIWLAVAACAYCVLFPAMWVAPADTLRSVYEEAALRISWAHPNPIYFLGQSFIGDPGPTYYLYTWAFKTTSVVSMFAVLALLYTVLDKSLLGRRRATIGLIFGFVFFFTLQMIIGAKKMPRYLLPAFPMVDILAGVGLAQWADRISNLPSPFSNLSRRIPGGLVLAGILVQAALILPRHPYYDTYFSELAGGARAGISAISTQWQGEGLDIAARVLNGLPGADQQTVGSHKSVFFRQYFAGQTVGVDEPADWYVFSVGNVLEGGDKEEQKVVDFYRHRQAWETVLLGGIPYAWVYRADAVPQNPLSFTFETGIRLIGYDLASSLVYPGQTLRLQLHWQALELQDEDYVVFVHLLSGADGRMVAQQDNPPVQGKKPTSQWKLGQVIVDPYDLHIPLDTPPGEYLLEVGLYRWPDVSRLTVRDDDGRHSDGALSEEDGVLLPDDRVMLNPVYVERSPSSPGVWIARVVALVLVLGAGVDLVRRDG